MGSIEDFVKLSSGSGDGMGSGMGSGSGSDDGSGGGMGSDSRSGSGWGLGTGVGMGDGDGEGEGEGTGLGEGSGWSWGSSRDILNILGCPVYIIDRIPTLLYSVHGSLARGAILHDDLTLSPCFVYRQDNAFAHGRTPREAREEAMEKVFDNMSEDERIHAFVKEHKKAEAYSNLDFFEWHHRLTGSCRLGREAFAREHGIDVENGSMTTEEFIRLTENAYGGRIIRKLKPLYGMKD